MPQVQVVDTTPNKPEPTDVERFFTRLGKDYKDRNDRVEIGKIIDEAKQNSNEAKGVRQARYELEKSNISPTNRVSALKNLDEIEKNIIARDKALNARVNKGILETEEKQRQKNNLLKAGWPEHAAEAFLDATPGVKAIMQREHKELTDRGVRKPLVSVPEGVDTEMTTEGPASLLEPKEEEWPAIKSPEGLTAAEKVALQNTNQKDNNAELKSVQEKKNFYRTNDGLIKNMTKINDSGKLPSGLGRLLIDPKTGDVRESVQVAGALNKETQLYVKSLKQFLKGAKDYFGARVTNFDVSTFLSQLPSLLNTEEGRRLILKQMDLVNELESIHTKEMDSALKHYGRNASYSDIAGVVDSKIGAREEALVGKINNIIEASDYLDQMAKNPDKFRGMTLFEKDGKFKAVRPNEVEIAKKKGWSKF